jgi:AraC-like DNA-binding protein
MATEAVDFLSNVLQGIQLHRSVVEEFNFEGSWRSTPNGAPVHFYCLLQGECRLEIESCEILAILNAGDLIVVPQDCISCFHDNYHSSIPLAEHSSTLAKKRSNPAICKNGKDAMIRLMSGHFHFKKQVEPELFALLPPFIHLRGVGGKAAPWLGETLKLILNESSLNQPGRQVIVDHLTQIIFIEAIRSCLKMLPIRNNNWLMAQLDPDIGPVLELMHSQPELPWTVASLAAHVCLSRSVFASRFKSLLSKTPYQYLLECRMRKACDLLSEGQYGIKKIASLSGYATEAAFNNAFKRWSGKTPGVFRRNILDRIESSDCATEKQTHGCEKIATVH